MGEQVIATALVIAATCAVTTGVYILMRDYAPGVRSRVGLAAAMVFWLAVLSVAGGVFLAGLRTQDCGAIESDLTTEPDLMRRVRAADACRRSNNQVTITYIGALAIVLYGSALLGWHRRARRTVLASPGE